ncbi:MAG: MFS transporter [Anaerolineae bacterium]|nr:MFS transporter [Anaerolineae bacterium]
MSRRQTSQQRKGNLMRGKGRNIGILFFTLVVVMLGFGMVIPILPYYIDAFGAGGGAMGMLMAIYALMQFFFAPVWGDLSDRFGRKPILLIGVLGNALSQVLFGLSTSLEMLFVARALAGILSSATLPTAMAYIGDSTSDEERGGGMGILGAAMGVGMVIGPGIAGWLAQDALSTPFFVAAALSTLALLLIAAMLPESLPVERRTTEGRKLRGPQLGAMWRALLGPLGVLMVLAFLLSFGMTNFESVFGLYALDRYEYGPQTVGLILMFIGLVSAVMQGALTGPFSRRWGESAIIRGSLLVSAIGFLLMLTAQTLAGVLVTVGVFVVGNAMLRPAVSSLISRRATVGQGMAMGLNNSFMSLGRIIGPMWAGFLFDVNIGFPYLSGAVIMLIGLVISAIWLAGRLPAEQAEAVEQADPAR